MNLKLLILIMVTFSASCGFGSRGATNVDYAKAFTLELSKVLIVWDSLYPKEEYTPDKVWEKSKNRYSNRTDFSWSIEELWIKADKSKLIGTPLYTRVKIDSEFMWIVAKFDGSTVAVDLLEDCPTEDDFVGLVRVRTAKSSRSNVPKN